MLTPLCRVVFSDMASSIRAILPELFEVGQRLNSFFFCSWETAFMLFRVRFVNLFSSSIISHSVYFFSGNLLDTNAVFFFKLFCNMFGLSNINVHAGVDVDLRVKYILSDGLSTLFNDSNAYLFLGINLKLSSPILNIRLKNNIFSSQSSIRIGYIGSNIELEYSYIHLGICSNAILYFFFGKSFFCYNLSKLVCISSSHNDVIPSLSHSHFKYNYLCLYTGEMSINELCALSYYNALSNYTCKKAIELLILVGADYLTHLLLNSVTFSIYIGHSLEGLRDNINIDYIRTPNIILPSSAFTEKEGFYVNCQGRMQVAGQATTSAGSA